MAQTKKIGLVGATFLVAGNMMGSGLFLLPASLARIGSSSIWGWLLTTFGALLLASVFAKLGKLSPRDGGPYAYARDWLGPYVGFQTNCTYWFSNWIGNVAMPIAAVGYFSHFFPIFENPLARCVAVIVLIWVMTLANIVGPRFVARLQTVTTSLVLVPTLGMGIFGWFYFRPELFTQSYNVSGLSDWNAISSAAALTLWAFIGVESASVTAAVVENPEKNVARATLAGVFIAAMVYMSCSLVITGIVPNAQLQIADAPFALAAAAAVGSRGADVVSFCASAGATGALGGWILLTAQSAKAAADDGLFPKLFNQANSRGIPTKGIVAVAALMTAAVLLTASSATAAAQFTLITSAAVVLTLLSYIYSCVACFFVVEAVETRKNAVIYWCLTTLTVLYCLWAIYSSAGIIVKYSTLFVLFITVFYPFFNKQQQTAVVSTIGPAETTATGLRTTLPLPGATAGQ